MKKFLRPSALFLALIMTLSCMFTFLSCDSDDEEPPKEEETAPPKIYKDFGTDEPYRITFTTEEGVGGCIATIEYNPYYTKPFKLEIPASNTEGVPVTGVACNAQYAAVPFYIPAEDYTELLDLMVAKHGVTYKNIGSAHIDEYESHQLARFNSFFVEHDPAKIKSDKALQALNEKFPITKTGTAIYVMDITSTTYEHHHLSYIVATQVPNWSDAWLYEKLLKLQTFCQENKVEDSPADPYIDLYSGFGESMTEFSLPASVTILSPMTFFGCDALTNVTVPGTVTSVSTCAFACCSKLEEITFAEGVTVIGDYALGGCTNLKTVNLPASLERIGLETTGCIFGLIGYNITDETTLPVINYAGTKEQWASVAAGFMQYYGNKFTINCSDGVYQ